MPQWSVSDTEGDAGKLTGDENPTPESLVHPFTVCVTEKLFVVVTVMDDVVAPVFHNNAPVAVVDKVELPQVSTPVTVGADGIVFGAAVAVPAALVHPFPDV